MIRVLGSASLQVAWLPTCVFHSVVNLSMHQGFLKNTRKPWVSE